MLLLSTRKELEDDSFVNKGDKHKKIELYVNKALFVCFCLFQSFHNMCEIGTRFSHFCSHVDQNLRCCSYIYMYRTLTVQARCSMHVCMLHTGAVYVCTLCCTSTCTCIAIGALYYGGGFHPGMKLIPG